MRERCVTHLDILHPPFAAFCCFVVVFASPKKLVHYIMCVCVCVCVNWHISEFLHPVTAIDNPTEPRKVHLKKARCD